LLPPEKWTESAKSAVQRAISHAKALPAVDRADSTTTLKAQIRVRVMIAVHWRTVGMGP